MKRNVLTSSSKAFVITIDGPAGSGKSTVSLELARRLKLVFLTTGAFYRGLAYLCQAKSIDISVAATVAGLSAYADFNVIADIEGTRVFIDGANVTDELSSEKVAFVASKISAYPEVRKALLGLQRRFSKPPGLIAEGRDCGTVVFPDADVKIFLTASLDKRAERRSSEQDSNSDAAAKKIAAERIANRDKADGTRKVAPMAKAEDAHEIDSSTLSVEEVVDKIEKIVRSKWKC
jgi:cytidylate kinase